MTRLSVDEFLNYFWAYACAAVAVREKRPPDLRSLESFVDAHFGNVADEDAQRALVEYDPKRRVLGLRAKDLGAFLSGPNTDTLFAPSRPVYRLLDGFLEDKVLARWRASNAPLQDVLSVKARRFLARLSESESPLLFQGAVVIGTEAGIVWLGLVDDPAPFIGLRPERRAALLQVRVTRYPAPPIASWVRDISLKSVDGYLKFTDFCEPFLRELLGPVVKRVPDENGLALHEGKDAFEGETLASWVISQRSEDFEDFATFLRWEYERHIGRFLKNEPVASITVLVFTTEPFSVVAPLLARLCRPVVARTVRFSVLDPDGLRGCLSRYPWLWSPVVGNRVGFRFVQCDDDEQLLAAFYYLRHQVLPVKNWVSHPALLRAFKPVPPGGLLRVVGRRGSGKSVALIHAARAHSAGIAVVIDWDATAADLARVEELLRVNDRRVAGPVLLIDDLHLAEDRGQHLLAQVLAMRNRLAREGTRREIPTVLSMLSREYHHMMRELLPIMEGFGEFVDVFLDPAPQEFLVAVGEAAKSSKQGDWVFDGVKEAVEAWPLGALTPASVVEEVVFEGREWGEKKERARFRQSLERDWDVRNRVRHLSPTAIAILSALGVLRELGRLTPLKNDVFSVARTLFEADESLLERELHELSDASWLSVHDPERVVSLVSYDERALGLPPRELSEKEKSQIGSFLTALEPPTERELLRPNTLRDLTLAFWESRDAGEAVSGPLAEWLNKADPSGDGLRDILHAVVFAGGLELEGPLRAAYRDRATLMHDAVSEILTEAKRCLEAGREEKTAEAARRNARSALEYWQRLRG